MKLAVRNQETEELKTETSSEQST